MSQENKNDHQYTILLVDDDETFCETWETVLSGHGYQVFVALDAKAALNIIARQNLDLVIIDILMPEIDGLELMAALRQSKPSLKTIAISGGGRIGRATYLQMAEAVGATKTLEKPFSQQEMLNILTEMLGPASQST